MRRRSLALAAFAALILAVPAAADLRPITRAFGELQIPRVRAGSIQIPEGHGKGRITVIVRLGQPPLARAALSFSSTAGSSRLSVRSASSREYLAGLVRAQETAARQIRRALPEATVGRRFRVLLNGLTVELPARSLPALVRQPFVTRVYASARYSLTTNDSPSIIGAPEIARLAGARGEGVKIAVVDDGIDQTNRFFAPAGLQPPRGFPKGARRWTSAKVIVARAFPGPGSGKAGRLAVDPRVSFHGTHVAGIAAGSAGTTAPAGNDHPRTEGLSGVAPRAWLGNYRVFTVPTPLGHVANTPEIIAAFESAVADGMDVINFSGGGPASEPANDALIEAVANVAAAGVVPVISSGNDRDDFGLGTAGSPGSAPEAISVAATSNAQVFARGLRVVSPGGTELGTIPFNAVGRPPASWASADKTLVDVGSILGQNGRPVDRRLCAPGRDPNRAASPLPARSLRGAIALVSRGSCTFFSKAERARAAGAIGIVLVDNRAGEANGIPLQLPIPAGMVADLDGLRLRELAGRSGGRLALRVGRSFARIETGRSGIVTSFSSAGPTAFGHELKPDLAAPGGQILSATLPAAGGPFAVFDGTSMSSPHVAGAAALLLQRHPAWTPRQVKSALMSTAGPAYGDTARTGEASVLLQGAGLINVGRADNPLVFSDPVSLSFGDVSVLAGAASRARLVRVIDAGGGAGSWQVELRPQAASAGATLELPPAVEVLPGGEGQLAVVVRAGAGAAVGENYGFVILRRGELTRKIPYLFIVTRPKLASIKPLKLRRFQVGSTIRGGSRVERYGYPTAPFGPPPDYTGPPEAERGSERLYALRLAQPAANLGVAVIDQTPGAQIDPWVLGSQDEGDVQGFAGTPVNVNPLTFDYRVDLGAAGASLPRPKTYYVSVDSGSDPFTGRSLPGRYLLQSWVDDVSPPLVVPITTRVSSGRPTLVARVLDGVFEPGSGVDPLSLAVGYGRVLVGAAAYDSLSGIAVFPLSREAPALRRGTTRAVVVASDYQESKNVNTSGEEIMPNTAFRLARIRVVDAPTVTWLAPEQGACVRRQGRLVVVAGSPARIRSVRFLDGARQIALVRRGAAGLYGASWSTKGLPRGRRTLRALVTDVRGRTAVADRPVRLCR